MVVDDRQCCAGGDSHRGVTMISKVVMTRNKYTVTSRRSVTGGTTVISEEYTLDYH